MYGFWSQVPLWAPRFVREFAGERKNRISQDFIALRDVSIQVRRAESVAIIGRNGSGKSTLLQIIAGVLQPSSGQFSVSTARITALLVQCIIDF
jgi:lipopolysaccharide transport system ATP-binding protein